MRNEIRETLHLPRVPKLTLLAAAIIPMALLASCGSGDRSPSEDFTATDAVGASATGGEPSLASLPDNFPAEFPLPPNLQIAQGTFTESSATTQGGYLIRGTSTMSVAELANFYNARLPKAGYDVQQSPPPSADATSALVFFQGDKFRDGSVQFNGSGGTTEVTVSLPLRD